jgi:flagellar hook protein FlgE
MIRSLTSGISGMQQFQKRLDVIGNNISNVNTTGFKSARVGFEDAFSQTVQASSPGTASTSSTSSIQVGSGVATAAVRNQFTQGAISRSGVGTDLAISGEGFFLVQDPVSGEDFASRAGDFRLDQNNYLVTSGGFRVQGFNDSNLATIGDLQIDIASLTPPPVAGSSVTSFSIDGEGIINLRLDDGSSSTAGQVLLQNFRDPSALTKEGGNLYSGLINAGPIATTPQSPATSGLGRIVSGALELSNVDLASEFAGLITTQRAFQASARVITTSDEILQELVNLKR